MSITNFQIAYDGPGVAKGAMDVRDLAPALKPLSGGRSVRLLFSGPAPTEREIDKLIAMLELSKDTFADEPDAE